MDLLVRQQALPTHPLEFLLHLLRRLLLADDDPPDRAGGEFEQLLRGHLPSTTRSMTSMTAHKILSPRVWGNATVAGSPRAIFRLPRTSSGCTAPSTRLRNASYRQGRPPPNPGRGLLPGRQGSILTCPKVPDSQKGGPREYPYRLAIAVHIHVTRGGWSDR